MNKKQLALLITTMIVVVVPSAVYYLGLYNPIGVNCGCNKDGVEAMAVGDFFVLGMMNVLVLILCAVAAFVVFGLTYLIYRGILNKLEK